MIGVDIGQPSLMFWGPKTNKVMIEDGFAATMSGFIPTLFLDIRGCHGS